ncbi:MAG: protein nirF, partial [Rhodoferax sp.]|nr:protein nirF [Rhodoferax sp.]
MTSPLLCAIRTVLAATLLALLGACASTPAPPALSRGTGDLGLVVGRADGSLTVVDTSARTALGTITGLGDLSHASLVYARDGATAFVFGRDGALTRVNLLQQRIEARIQQAGNSIGGAISQDGSLVAAQNYQPGGVKVFDARTLQLVADIPARYDAPGAAGKTSRVVGLADLPGKRFIFSLFDANQIWIADLSQSGAPVLTKFTDVGRQPYDALVTPDGRHYIAGLFGEDGLAMIDLWEAQPKVRRILGGYGR